MYKVVYKKQDENLCNNAVETVSRRAPTGWRANIFLCEIFARYRLPLLRNRAGFKRGEYK